MANESVWFWLMRKMDAAGLDPALFPDDVWDIDAIRSDLAQAPKTWSKMSGTARSDLVAQHVLLPWLLCEYCQEDVKCADHADAYKASLEWEV